MLLHYRSTSSLRICMSSLALEPNCRADKDTRVATAESDENNPSCSQRLYVQLRCRWSILLLTHLSHDVSSWLSVSLEFRRSVLRKSSCLHYLLPDKRDSRYHRQITPPKNIQAIADENWKISQIIFNERGLTFAICHRPSVCLSVVCLVVKAWWVLFRL